VSAPQRQDPRPSLRRVRRELSGWGCFPVETCDVYRPERLEEVKQLLRDGAGSTLIARGRGRSYGDSALNAAGGVVLTERLDRMLGFDPEAGILHCEAGVTLAEILEVFVPRGYFFAVTPGTKFISVGGAIAADVHGKNHHRTGSIAGALVDFKLLTPHGELLRCARDENADLFFATLGGMGLTGVIAEARVRLRRIATAAMRVTHRRAADLDAALEDMLAEDARFDYAVTWIDALRPGRSRGRAVAMRAEHARPEELPAARRNEPLALRPRRRLTVPFRMPGFTLNALSMAAFNEAFYRGHPDRDFIQDFDAYFYPLDGIHHWNRMYGRRGVIQFQCLLPPKTARRGLTEILTRLSSARRPSFLAVLKSCGPASGGLLSFPAPGYTLALDLPHTGSDLLATLAELEAIVLREGGRIYLAKDACLRAEAFEAMYPRLPAFCEARAKVDPEGRLASSQARRLGLVETP
jgi:decaprenylphospho-beta-D-ribofuranose 2-oxidase